MEDLRRAWELAYCGSLALLGEDPGKGSHDRHPGKPQNWG